MRLILRVLYPLYRLFSAVRHRAARRFTPAGGAMLGAFALVAPLAVDTENNVAYQAACLILALLVMALLFGWRLRVPLAFERTLPRFASVGVPVRYPLRIRNLDRRTQSGLTCIESLVDGRPSAADWVEFQRAEERRLRRIPIWRRQMRHPFRVARFGFADIPALPPQQSAEIQMELVPLRRGLMRFEAVTLGRPDPLGLFNALRQQPLPESLLVLPRRYNVPSIALPGSMKYQQGGVAMASSVGQSDEFVSLREYRRGDPYRHIHWRSWAKTGIPIVKEHEDEFFVRHALVLDTFCADPFSEAFEEAVSVAASFACSLQSQESLLDLLFAGTKAYCFTAGRGLAHADQLLEVLAEVRAVEDDQGFHLLEELVLKHADRVSGCICVLLAWDDRRRELVRKLRVLGTPVLVFVVVDERQKGGVDAGPMRDEPQHFRVLKVGHVAEALAQLELQ